MTMEAALIIAGAIVLVGALLYIHHRLTYSRAADLPADNLPTDAAEPAEDSDSQCCGMHITCERDSLLSALSDKIVYYDDEELDAFAGREADDYTGQEIEQFRDVMLTLLPEDIAGWARSIQLRGITLPQAVRDELIMIVSEARALKSHA